MSKKINLEEILEQVVQKFYSESKDSDLKKFRRDSRNKAIELAAMKEACKHVLELAAEIPPTEELKWEDYWDCSKGVEEVNTNYKQSILDIIKLVE